MERKLAIITGADGGMGMEITRAVAREGNAGSWRRKQEIRIWKYGR